MVDVFISWSKPASHEFAKILHKWLPEVIQELNPWISSEDIDKGARWAVEVGEKLNKSSESIICVTSDNVNEPWLNFEAGALAKSLDESRVRPVLFGLAPHTVVGPLTQFQATVAAEYTDMSKLLRSLNQACQRPLKHERLERAFKKHWRDFLEDVETVHLESADASRMHGKSQEVALLTEILDGVRKIHRFVSDGRSATSSTSRQKLPPPPGFESAVFPPVHEIQPRPERLPYDTPAAQTASTAHVLAVGDTIQQRPVRHGASTSRANSAEVPWPPSPVRNQNDHTSTPAHDPSAHKDKSRHLDGEYESGQVQAPGI